MKKEFENIKMRGCYSVRNYIPQKRHKFIAVYNWQHLDEVDNCPKPDKPTLRDAARYPLIGVWQIKNKK